MLRLVFRAGKRGQSRLKNRILRFKNSAPNKNLANIKLFYSFLCYFQFHHLSLAIPYQRMKRILTLFFFYLYSFVVAKIRECIQYYNYNFNTHELTKSS